MSSKVVPPASGYLRAPVCCLECEAFWKALILEVDEKHTSRVPAGKASLVMAKGGLLQIQSTKQVTKERRFLPSFSCKNVTVRGDACHSVARQITANPIVVKRAYPQKKLTNPEAFVYKTQSGLSSLPGRKDVQNSLQTGYKAYGAVPKYDVISTPRRHSHVPKSAVCPEPSPNFIQTRSHQLSSVATNEAQRSEAKPVWQNLKPVRTRVDQRAKTQGFSQLSTPRRYTPMYSESFPTSHGVQQQTDSSQVRPFTTAPATTRKSGFEKAKPRQGVFTPRVYSSPLPRASKLAEDILPTQTARSLRWRDTQNCRERYMNDSVGAKASPKTLNPRHITLNPSVNATSPVYPRLKEDYPNSGFNNRRNLSRTSTFESDYTTLSIPLSDSSSSSQDLDGASPQRSELNTKPQQPQDLGPGLKFRHSRTLTGTSSAVKEPIMLFTGHGCRSECSDEEDDDIVVTNPNYFKHVINDPEYFKRIGKPLCPPVPPVPPGLKRS